MLLPFFGMKVAQLLKTGDLRLGDRSYQASPVY